MRKNDKLIVIIGVIVLVIALIVIYFYEYDSDKVCKAGNNDFINIYTN
jgi:uncharacterized protein YpmB